MSSPTERVVTKRDGTRVPYDVSKIKKSIAFATKGINVNPLQLESRIDQTVKPGMKTKDIQLNVIQHAVQLASPVEPQWLLVAGRAYAMDEQASFKLRDKSFYEVVLYNIKKGEYAKELLDFYSEEDINYLETVLDHERDFNHSYASLVTAKKKYLGKFELNQHMHMVNAMRFGQFEPAETRLEFVKEAYDALSLRKISLATPFMANLRRGGNIASCFILAVEDDLESIYDNVKRAAMVSKNGGGLGVFLGYLRAKGDDVARASNAAGPITQWVKLFNDTAVAVNQEGRRAGAITLALPVWHNDILEFLDLQTEHGDPRMKAFDIFPQITAPDIYMQRVEEQGRWVTFSPHEVKKKLGIDVRGLHGEAFTEAYLKIEAAIDAGRLKVFRVFDNARTLMKTTMRVIFETGMPYWAFTDTMNVVNPNKGSGEIVCVNLCTESFSNVVADEEMHVCNLCSINLGSIDRKELPATARLSTRMLDYGISMTAAPTPLTAKHNDKYRTIGIGIMGLHDYLAREDLTYKNLDVIADIAECIEYYAALESTELAKKFGSFKAFDKSEWKSGGMTQLFKSRSNGKYDWDAVQRAIDTNGMRNSQLTSPAPTTSTSIYQDATATYLPIFEAFFAEDNANGSMKVAGRFLEENPLGYVKGQRDFDAKEIIDITWEIQKFTDTGVSMELQLDQNREGFNAKVMYDAIMHAWKKGCKAIYYIRTIKKNETLEKKEADCDSCAG
jgi:ribonucleoside-diphosphate reductase alpha chain